MIGRVCGKVVYLVMDLLWHVPCTSALAFACGLHVFIFFSFEMLKYAEAIGRHGPSMARAVHVCARLCFWYHMYYNMIGGHGPVMARAGHVRGLFLFSRSRARCARLCSW
jgi:hypothetical protein